ncbi:MAG: methylmalonyl-CoA mutase family protein [Candidatus Eisenbacteria bacterium]
MSKRVPPEDPSGRSAAYRPADAPIHYARDLGDPGEPPYTRGIYPTMYRGRPWTMRQYAGFGSAEQTNQRFHELLAAGQTGLSVAFDLPTQMGYDSDHARAAGEVGRVGVAISTLADMEALTDGLPLDRVSTSMTINSTAAILLCLYVATAKKRGLPLDSLSGTVQNDLLKEYVARGTYIYPPAASLRITTDLFAWCAQNLPQWNTISISGYHIREAGSTAAQELAFTIADGLTYVQAAVDAGLDIDTFAPRLSFFFNAHNDLLEEVSKFRAARRLWTRLMEERFHPKDPRSSMLRFHTQTAGSTLTAQQPQVNVVRTTVQALSAILGGTQSLHTNSFDEALGLPTVDAARLALRTQQVLSEESGVADTADPLGGSWYVEALTTKLETEARDYLAKIDAMGGMLRAIETGYVQREIHEAAYAHQQAVEAGTTGVVGVNRYVEDEAAPANVFEPDVRVEKARAAFLASWRTARDAAAGEAAAAGVERAARGTENLLPHILASVEAHATLGEISDRMRAVFGVYRPPALF